MTARCTLLIGALLVSLAGIVHAAIGVPFMVEAVVRRWKPDIVVSLGSLVSAAVFFGIPLITWWRLRARVEKEPQKLVIVCRYAAVSSLVAQFLVFAPLMILALLPATNTSGNATLRLGPLTSSNIPENAPSPSADEQVFLPSGQDYARTPQIVAGQPQNPKFDWVTLPYDTVADVAQTYADFSGKEVRVARTLAARSFFEGRKYSSGMHGNATHGHVIWLLDSKLPAYGIEVVPLSARVVAFRAAPSRQDRAPSRVATEADRARYAARMSEDRFWTLLDAAARRGGHDCERVARALQGALSRLDADEILGFALRHEEFMVRSYRFDLWAVAYIVNGGASDDGFTYFRAWLIGQGRERFEAALKHPPDAVRGLITGAAGTGRFECEALLYPAYEAYQAKTGQLLPAMGLPFPGLPAGTPWREEDLPGLYPELSDQMR